jgi:hypothetical protein
MSRSTYTDADAKAILDCIIVNALSFRDYVMVDFMIKKEGINILATKKKGLHNFLEDLRLSKLRINSVFYLCDNLIRIRVSVHARDIAYDSYIVHLAYTDSKNSNESVSSTKPVSSTELALRKIMNNSKLDYKGCYYDGNNIFYTPQARKCLLTKKITNIESITLDDKAHLEFAQKQGFKLYNKSLEEASIDIKYLEKIQKSNQAIIGDSTRFEKSVINSMLVFDLNFWKQVKAQSKTKINYEYVYMSVVSCNNSNSNIMSIFIDEILKPINDVYPI